MTNRLAVREPQLIPVGSGWCALGNGRATFEATREEALAWFNRLESVRQARRGQVTLRRRGQLRLIQ